MIVAAVLAGGFVIASFSQTLLEFEFGKAFGRRRMERELAKLSGHYIICGAGRVGRTVARQLRANGETCVLIERDPNRARWAEEEKIPVIVGNASSEDILQKAHIDTARGFVSGGQLGRRKSLHRAHGARIPPRSENHRARQRGRGYVEIIARGRVAGALALQLHRASHRATAAAPQRARFRRRGVWTRAAGFRNRRSENRGSLEPRRENLADPAIPRQAGVIVLALRSADGTMTFNPPPESVIRADDCLIVIGKDEHIEAPRIAGELIFRRMPALARIGEAAGAAQEIAQGVGVNARQADENPLVIQIMVGDVVRSGSCAISASRCSKSIFTTRDSPS